MAKGVRSLEDTRKQPHCCIQISDAGHLVDGVHVPDGHAERDRRPASVDALEHSSVSAPGRQNFKLIGNFVFGREVT